MTISVVLAVELVTIFVLTGCLYRGPVKLIALASVIACAAFQLAVIVDPPSLLGILLFSAWMIGSVGQIGTLIVVCTMPKYSRTRAYTVMSLIVGNCANGWFLLQYYDAVAS